MKELKLRFHCEPDSLSDTTEITIINREDGTVFQCFTVQRCLTKWEAKELCNELVRLLEHTGRYYRK